MSPIFLAPRLPTNKLPEGEQDYARFIEWLLRDMSRRCADFGAAVELFDYSDAFLTQSNRLSHPTEYELRWHWRGFAAREAAATLYRFWECIESVGKNLGECPVLASMIDHAPKRAATKAFKSYFPGAHGIRHGSQHFAKLYGTPEQFAAHAASEEMNYVNYLEGRTVRTIFEGSHVELAISEENHLRLTEVRDLYWEAFMPSA